MLQAFAQPHSVSRAEDTTGFREQVERLLWLCYQWRDRVEAEAVQLAHSAVVPASPVVYWILKCLEDSTVTVEFPCTRVELHVPTLQAASKHTQVALVAAVLQTVHNLNHAPHSPVRPHAFCVSLLSLVLSDCIKK